MPFNNSEWSLSAQALPTAYPRVTSGTVQLFPHITVPVTCALQYVIVSGTYTGRYRLTVIPIPYMVSTLHLISSNRSVVRYLMQLLIRENQGCFFAFQLSNYYKKITLLVSAYSLIGYRYCLFCTSDETIFV